jgi:endonuclease G, mitochondrial
VKFKSIISNLFSFAVVIALLWLTGCSTIVTQNIHLKYGNPSNANGSEKNYLITKPQYALSYNCQTGTANWVSWQLDRSWLGQTERSDHFMPNLELPADCYAVRPSDYSNSGYDRGHLIPSGDRTHNQLDNDSTFVMTNIIPQSPSNNREVWRELEEYSRELALQDKELYLVAGGEGIAKKIAQSQVVVPEYTWKVILILDDPGREITTENAKTLAVWMPNSEEVVNTKWQDYIVAVDEVESRTGYNFFEALPKDLQSDLEKTSSARLP